MGRRPLRYWSFLMNARCFAGEPAAAYYSQSMEDFKHFRLPESLMYFFGHIATQRVVANDAGDGLRVAYNDEVGVWEEGHGEESLSSWVGRTVARFGGGRFGAGLPPETGGAAS